MGLAVFRGPPTSVQVRTFLGRLYVRARPKYLICDKGSQFWCDGFRRWCKRKGIRPRFGAIGQRGSIAVVERFIRSVKDECARRIAVPYRRQDIRRELAIYLDWFNRHRPHEFLVGRTPDEVYRGQAAASQAPRIEPRARWPRQAPCAAPQTPIRGKPGETVHLVVNYHGGRKHLPVISLVPAA